MKKPVTPEMALMRLQNLCARAEHCSSEIMSKLASWKIGAEDSVAIIETLMRDKFVDDGRFACAYATDKMRFGGWGRYKIVRGLMAKRICRQYIDDAIECLDSEEYKQVCRRVLITKAMSVKEGNTREGKTKLFRSGAARGFEPALVASLIRSENLWEPCDE